jgi:hypothetical protein
MYVIGTNEKQISIKIVQTVEKLPVIYDYSSPGHSNKEEVDKAWQVLECRFTTAFVMVIIIFT